MLKYTFVFIAAMLAVGLAASSLKALETDHASVSAATDYQLPVRSGAYDPVGDWLTWVDTFSRTPITGNWTIVVYWVEGPSFDTRRQYDSRLYPPGGPYEASAQWYVGKSDAHQLWITTVGGGSLGHFTNLKQEAFYSQKPPGAPSGP